MKHGAEAGGERGDSPEEVASMSHAVRPKSSAVTERSIPE
jgi:hypothetical protein